MKSKKLALAENPSIDQYVKRSSPVISTSIPGAPDRRELRLLNVEIP